MNGHSYLTGPLARLHLNYERLSPLVKQVLAETGLTLPFKKASMGIIARALEVLYAFDEALRLIKRYTPPDEPAVPVTLQSGVGMACTEAPRGMLYHHYRVNPDGTIVETKIIPPTSQNQRRIESDLRTVLRGILYQTRTPRSIVNESSGA